MDTLGNSKCIKVLEFDIDAQDDVIKAMSACLTLDFDFTVTYIGENGLIVVRIYSTYDS